MSLKPLRMKYYDDQQTGSLRKALEQEILGWPGVAAKPMMGCLCYFHGRKFFAFLVTGAVVITKLAEEDRAALSKKTGGVPFEMDGKTVKAWVRVPLRGPGDVNSVLPVCEKELRLNIGNKFNTHAGRKWDIMPKEASAYFSPGLFKFLTELKRNNNREWFARNKARYEKFYVDASVRFIKDVGAQLKTISPYLAGDPRPFGGSLFRIYRDTRFSKDKSPYKPWLALDFWHKRSRQKTHSVGLYLHIGPGEIFAGGGLWHPEPPLLSKIRKRIVANPTEWKKVIDSVPKLEGEKLKRPPAGFDRDHPFIEDLKRKDFIAVKEFTRSQVVSQGFVDDFVRVGKELDPLNRFIAEAMGLPW